MIRPELKELVEQEGNVKEFVYRNYDCKIVRQNVDFSGHLCGYIKIPKGHELYGMEYGEIEEKYNYEMPAHGGLTFSDYFETNDYWIGFDCAHVGDLRPCYVEGFDFGTFEFETYKSMEYVENCIKEIIDFMEGQN